ncbi:hypothetical protein CVT25_014328 [Psilocybe cyanescens]|uniref:Uncharacterized protein n=1 Tax=Psilocybe cyanescens TaxID=93625 RepID=A0A409XKZ9_PSICY|nr:hypothetical protein CVT25_014328 [Psilocybe cyanescens]
MTPTPSSVTQDTRHILPLGSIVAIILGILFCITIAGVIIVITRPRFGSLARLWKDSRTPGSYLPSTVNSFEPKQQRDSSNLYRRYNPVQRPFSRTFFDLQAFRFDTAGNGIGQGSTISHQHNNLVASNIARKYNDFQAHQIYSTGIPPPSAVPKPASRSMSSKTSKQPTYSSISSRIMSIMDAFSDSGVGSGRTSLKSYNWKPPRNDPASEGHA